MEDTKPNLLQPDMQMLIAGIIPNARHFDSRFDLLQVQIDGLKHGQMDMKENLKTGQIEMKERLEAGQIEMKERITGLEKSVDRRFEQVDKRFEQVDKRFEQVDKRFEQVDKRLGQIVDSLDRLGDKLDRRDENQRHFTIKMFSIAITLFMIGISGAFLKAFGII